MFVTSNLFIHACISMKNVVISGTEGQRRVRFDVLEVHFRFRYMDFCTIYPTLILWRTTTVGACDSHKERRE